MPLGAFETVRLLGHIPVVTSSLEFQRFLFFLKLIILLTNVTLYSLEHPLHPGVDLRPVNRGHVQRRVRGCRVVPFERLAGAASWYGAVSLIAARPGLSSSTNGGTSVPQHLRMTDCGRWKPHY